MDSADTQAAAVSFMRDPDRFVFRRGRPLQAILSRFEPRPTHELLLPTGRSMRPALLQSSDRQRKEEAERDRWRDAQEREDIFEASLGRASEDLHIDLVVDLRTAAEDEDDIWWDILMRFVGAADNWPRVIPFAAVRPTFDRLLQDYISHGHSTPKLAEDAFVQLLLDALLPADLVTKLCPRGTPRPKFMALIRDRFSTAYQLFGNYFLQEYFRRYQQYGRDTFHMQMGRCLHEMDRQAEERREIYRQMAERATAATKRASEHPALDPAAPTLLDFVQVAKKLGPSFERVVH
ncbi:hypothetical protein JCM10213v2_000943 [Rhodosporidiobolus nylandii]